MDIRKNNGGVCILVISSSLPECNYYIDVSGIVSIVEPVVKCITFVLQPGFLSDLLVESICSLHTREEVEQIGNPEENIEEPHRRQLE